MSIFSEYTKGYNTGRSPKTEAALAIGGSLLKLVGLSVALSAPIEYAHHQYAAAEAPAHQAEPQTITADSGNGTVQISTNERQTPPHAVAVHEAPGFWEGESDLLAAGGVVFALGVASGIARQELQRINQQRSEPEA